MKIIPLIQKTSLWIEWRKNGLGASVVQSVIGASPYKTAYTLWGEIIGIFEPDDLSRNPNVIRGNHYEDEANSVYSNHANAKFESICIESDLGYPFISSLDGYSKKLRKVLEIKCPSESTWADIIQRKRLSEAYRLYYTQVQYQLLCCDDEVDAGVLFFYNVETKESIAFNIEPNIAYQEWLKTQVLAFWQCVISKTPPKLDLERDCITPELTNSINLDSWKELSYKLVLQLAEKKRLEAQVKVIEEQRKQSEQAIINLLGGFKQGECFGVKVAVSKRSGSVNYEAAYKELSKLTGQSVVLDKKADSFSTRISINKKRGEDITEDVIQSVKSNLINQLASQSFCDYSL